MDFDRDYFEDKTAVITGGASGIGLALAEELLKSNAKKVVIADINKEKLAAQDERLNALYEGRLLALMCDVTSEEEFKGLIKESVDFFDGGIDLLFNNAGRGFGGYFEELGNEDWEEAFALNFYSALYGMRAVLPIMLEQGSGQILNIISGIAFYPMAKQTRYAATKAALNGLTLAMRTEYWDRNIKFSSATPGTTVTSIWEEAGPDVSIPESAQTAEQSAQRILNGAVKNYRVIFGDDSDLEGSLNCFNYKTQDHIDDYLLDVARKRADGQLVV